MKSKNTLENLRHLIIDMDGVLWRGDQPARGLVEFFFFLRENEIDAVLATNNASKVSDVYVRRLAGYGVDISRDQVITSADATAQFLAGQSAPGTPVYCIGEDGLHEALTRSGFRIVNSAISPEYVVVGWDRQLTYEKLAQATIHIRAGARFVATNPDRTWPGELGLLPGAGAILAAVQAATDVEPTVIGKPSPLMLRMAMQRMGATEATTAMLGDRLETDVLGGIHAGVTTILVLSGVTRREDLPASPFQPDLVFGDISELTVAWRKTLA